MLAVGSGDGLESPRPLRRSTVEKHIQQREQERAEGESREAKRQKRELAELQEKATHAVPTFFDRQRTEELARTDAGALEGIEWLQRSWKFLNCACFIYLFRSSFGFPRLTVDELESSFVRPHGEAYVTLLIRLAAALQSQSVTLLNVDDRVRYVLRDRIELEAGPINAMPIDVKIEVLYLLQELVFEVQAPAVLVDNDHADEFRLSPLGSDANGVRYWMFEGLAPSRLYCECPPLKRKDVEPQWLLGAAGVGDWQLLADHLDASRSRVEKDLNEMLGGLPRRIVARNEAKERGEARRAMLDMLPRRGSSRVLEKRIKDEQDRELEEINRSIMERELLERKEREKQERAAAIAEARAREAEQKRVAREEAEAVSRAEKALTVAQRAIRVAQRGADAEMTPPPATVVHATIAAPDEVNVDIATAHDRQRWLLLLRSMSIVDSVPLKIACRDAINMLKAHPMAFPFVAPVDPVALGIPDYFDVIKRPMDLSTVYKNLMLDRYASYASLRADVHQIFQNCYTYNLPNSDVVRMAQQLEDAFDAWERSLEVNKLLTQEQNEQVEGLTAHPSDDHPVDVLD